MELREQGELGVVFAEQTADMWTFGLARGLFWTKASLASPSWSAGSVSGASVEHDVENIMLRFIAHHACCPFLQRNLQEVELCKVSLTCHFAPDVLFQCTGWTMEGRKIDLIWGTDGCVGAWTALSSRMVR